MSFPTTTKQKSPKKQTKFDKLWQRANKAKLDNERLRQTLDEIVLLIQDEVLPREIEVCKANKPLLFKLLTLGQRKSMTNWERETLDDWIQEITELIQANGLVDNEILDALAMYDAFRLGIQLEDENLAPYKQLVAFIERSQQEQLKQQEENEKHKNQLKETMISNVESEVEQELDQIFGTAQEGKSGTTADFFEGALDEATQKRRAAMRVELIAARLEAIEAMFSSEDEETLGSETYDELLQEVFEEFEAFSDEATPAPPYSDKRDPTINNDVFMRLFRATAGKLHPDREPDENKRIEKQKLMARLLKARKSGDLVTVLELYETWVGKHESFSKSEQKMLTAQLENWIDQLEEEADAIIATSPLHIVAYENFYSRSKNKVQKQIKAHLANLSQNEKNLETMARAITSLKSLKPYLAERYDMNRFDYLPDLEAFFTHRG